MKKKILIILFLVLGVTLFGCKGVSTTIVETTSTTTLSTPSSTTSSGKTSTDDYRPDNDLIHHLFDREHPRIFL